MIIQKPPMPLTGSLKRNTRHSASSVPNVTFCMVAHVSIQRHSPMWVAPVEGATLKETCLLWNTVVHIQQDVQNQQESEHSILKDEKAEVPLRSMLGTTL